MTADSQFAVIARKASTGLEVVFGICGDPDSAAHLCEELRALGLAARVQVVRQHASWPGQSWPPIQANRGE